VAERVRIASHRLSAEIAHLGAELQSLRDLKGTEYMSAGDPAFWSGRAPLLFPIVGRLNGDSYRIDGQHYALPQHGFARRSEFALIGQDSASALFRLVDSPASRGVYPYAFALDAHYALDDATLAVTITVRNPGDDDLLASFGFHPAFAWPLPGSGARNRHLIVFEREEPAALSWITSEGLIGADDRPTPVIGRTLALADDLFTKDALVWKQLASRKLTYGAPGATTLEIGFPDTNWLGIWTKPDASFVCIEPWAGMADPQGFSGDFANKPGVFTLPPGGKRVFRMTVAVSD